ncbi:Protein of unknown function (DUF668) [Abeliophyllum distichum]|uniref:DUF668 domain-containing protein n=1 Tax=Abeliophyllum distichum TaxID=126358 RepID=A0ABD1UN43_9LAMI
MDKKAKKLERFIATNAYLYQEMETLADLEETLKRMKGNDDADSISLVEYEKKFGWNRTYNYTIHLLARSVFTMYGRIGHVFGINHVADVGVTDSRVSDSSYSRLNQSILYTQSSVHPSDNSIPMFSSGSLGSVISKSGPISRANNVGDFHLGPLGNSIVASSPISGRRSADSFYSLFNFMKLLLNAPPETLGAAALALHYANIIIVIEKLVASPHLLGNEARTDLYNMLPASIRASLRVRLKPWTKSLSSSFYDTALAGEWNQAMSYILDWLAPLAHNMIRWQSERSFEQQNLVSRSNVLLVQTLYFANQEKTEASITELLVGLNYVWRFGKEVNAKSLHHWLKV